MALRALMIRKRIDDANKALAELETRSAELETRSAEIETAISEATSEEERTAVDEMITEYEKDVAECDEKKEQLSREIEELESELNEIEENNKKPEEQVEEREVKDMAIEVRDTKEYIDAFARYIKTGKDEEVRSLLTTNVEGGVVPVPTIVDGVVKTAWEKETIMSAVRKTYLKGNVKVGFEISATGAVVHTEGSAAPAEETLTLGIVTMVPSNIKKWITVSDEALDLNGEAFLNYIYSELTYQIAKKAADLIIAAIVASPTASTATAAGQPEITKAISQATISEAIGMLSDEAVNPVIIMNKATYAAFKAAQYAGNFASDIFEGFEVKFNNTLPAYASASAGAVYAIVGDLGTGVQANFPNGNEIKFIYDEKSLSEKDLVKIVGREYVGLGIVAPNRFVKIKKA